MANQTNVPGSPEASRRYRVGKTDTACDPTDSMSRDRTRTRDRSGDGDDEFDAEFELGPEFETDADGQRPRAGTEEASGGLRARAAERAGTLFAPRIFLAALLVTVGALFATSTFVPLPGAGLAGVFAAAFLFGLVLEERRYAETALSGALAAGGSAFLDFAVVALVGGIGLPLVAVAGGLGAVVAAVGTYFGRDLRDGLTRDI